MSSQTSSSFDLRKLVDSEADEVFVLTKKREATITKTVSFSISDLLEKINDENNKKKPIATPTFKLGYLDFYFEVYPDDEGCTWIVIQNPNEENVKMSFVINKKTFMSDIEANTGLDLGNINHDDYRQWAGKNRDVFKITAVVTLHLQEESEQWTTLR